MLWSRGGAHISVMAAGCGVCVLFAFALGLTHLPGNPAAVGLIVTLLLGTVLATDLSIRQVPDVATLPFAILPVACIWLAGGTLQPHVIATVFAFGVALPMTRGIGRTPALLGAGDVLLIIGLAGWLGPAIWDGILALLVCCAVWIGAQIAVSGRATDIPLAGPVTGAMLYAWPPALVGPV